MTNDKITIANALTGETIEREMTDAEQAERNSFLARVQAEEMAAEQVAIAAAAAKQALLDKLGITAEEAQLLLGGN